MIKRVSTQETQELLSKLCKIYTKEEIAVAIGKTTASLYMWQSGRRVPDKANFEALKKLLGGQTNV